MWRMDGDAEGMEPIGAGKRGDLQLPGDHAYLRILRCTLQAQGPPLDMKKENLGLSVRWHGMG